MPCRTIYSELTCFSDKSVRSTNSDQSCALKENTWEETCAGLGEHDELRWDPNHDLNNPYRYLIPDGSFCSKHHMAFFPRPSPINCKTESLPIVTFYFRHYSESAESVIVTDFV